MTRVVQIDGAPGAGKTHTLTEKLREHAEAGLGADSFWWLNFTNSGREDVEPKLAELFPSADDPESRAKTFHGLALSLMIRGGEINPDTVGDQIITPGGEDTRDYYRAFCDHHGLRFDPNYSDPRSLLAGDKGTEHTGNLLFAVNDYLTQTCKPPEKWRSAPVSLPIDSDRVPELLRAWDEYKRERFNLRLYEHGDYVAAAYDRGLVPSVGVLLVDEFQDLAPVEYRLFKLWRDSSQLDVAYVSGDPNQAIYSFRGGTPYYFEETPIDERIGLKESWRCPGEIAAVGNAVLSGNADTDPRGFHGKTAGGTAKWSALSDAQALRRAVIDATDRHPDADPSVLLLTRTRNQRYRLMQDLKRVGVPFEVLGTAGGMWRDDLRQILAFLNNLRSGGTAFAWQNVKKVLAALPDGDDRRKATARPTAGVLDRDGLAPVLAGSDGPSDLVSRLQVDSWKRDVLTNAVEAPAAMSPKEVRVGTIHTAKGLEAPVVYLFAETTDSMVQRYSRDDRHAAEEHRVYYVGATRASEELHMIDDYFGAPTAPAIKHVRTRGVVA